MKNCPRCRLPFPDEFSVCPKDGSLLQYLQEWQPGDVVREKYRIIAKIGQGGMGAIYKAEHLIFEELRALKVLMPELAHDESLVRYLQQEARITRRLSHPNAVRVEDVDRAEDGRLFIAMEYVEGRSIKELIKQTGPLSVPRVIELARQLCSALDTAHSLGMIHRDIKPDNVLLVHQADDRDLVKVLDFGIAKIKESAKERGKDISGVTMTKTGFVVGTPQYMSPEQAMGKPGDQLDGRSDLYSVGVLMYEALTGELPFHADTPMGYLLHHVNTPPPSLLDRRPNLTLPDPIVRIIMKALEKDPADRFQSAREMILALAAAAETFERETVVKRVGAVRPQKAEATATPAPPGPSAPAKRAEGAREARAPAPVAAASPPPGHAEVEKAGDQALTTPWETHAPSPSKWATFVSLIRLDRVRAVAQQEWVRPAAIVFLLAVSVGSGIRLAVQLRRLLWPSSGVVIVEPPPQVPTVTLTAEPSTVEKGQSVTLSWTSRNATDLDLQPGVGKVQAQGPTAVTPSDSTTYTLTAKGPGGSNTATARVTVTVPPPPPPGGTETETEKPTQKPGHRLTGAQQVQLKSELAVGDFLMEKGNYDAAIQAYQEALKIDRTNRQAQEGLHKARQLRDTLKSIIK